MRITVISEAPINMNPTAGDGFASRNASLISALAIDHDVRLFYLCADATLFEPYCQLPMAKVRASIIRRPSLPMTKPGERTVALGRTAGRLLWPSRWERQLLDAVRESRPDAVIGVCRLRPELLTVVSAHFPTAVCVEEEIRTRPLTATGRPPVTSSALQALERSIRRRSIRTARSLIVVSRREVAWARRLHDAARVDVVPAGVDGTFWSSPSGWTDVGPAYNKTVFVIGHMHREMNARGLRDIAQAVHNQGMGGSVRFVVASATKLHPILSQLPQGLIESVGTVADPRPFYRRAAAALIPAFKAPGVKTTAVQAWAAGCPVVVSTDVAGPLEATDGVDVASGATPGALAGRLSLLVHDRQSRETLIAGGLDHFHRSHSIDAQRRILNEILNDVVDPEGVS